MFLKFHILIIALLLPVVAGCTVEPNRDSTEMKSASDVKISVGESTAEEETPDESVNTSVPSESTPSSNASTPVKPEAKTDTSAVAETDTAPKKDMAKPAEAASENAYTGPPKFFGRVTVTGKPPQFPALLAKGGATKDAVCAEMAVPNESVVVSADGGLANVFVYMKKAPKTGVPEPTGDQPIIDQVGCVFIPHASIIRLGQPVTLKNSDPVAHNVNVKAFQEAYNNVVPANGSIDHTFRFAERLPASTGCDFHTFMSAFVLPVDHPWAVVTDAEGRFEIPNLPEGSWDFIVWHEKVGYVERSVTVKAAPNQAIEMNFEVPASKLSQ